MSEIPAAENPVLTKTSLDHYQVLAAGTLIAGRYRIDALVGVGGMGMIYRVHDERLHVTVALKVLRPDSGADAHMLARLEQELILARQVSHRNVVRIHDIGQDSGEHGELHFLTMDFVEGRSLKQTLEEEGRLDLARAIAIGTELADALAAAHREGVVHRDLKPANVLIAEDGHASITDFGVARSMNQAGLTKAGSVVGTLDYLAPEQARGEPVDGRSDVYALGLILFEMLSGELPFSGESAEEVLAQRTIGKPRQLNEVGVDVPAWLGQVLARCLERDPANRYQDAAELAADLAAGRAAYRRRGYGRRVGAAAAALLLAGAAVSLGFRLLDRSDVPAAARHVIAVLPLANRTERSEFDPLSTGLAEILAQALAESAALQVTDPLRVFRTLDDLRLDPAALDTAALRRLGDLLDADRLVAGNIRAAGEQLRIELRLLDASLPAESGKTFQAESATLADTFALAETLGQELRAALADDAAADAPNSLSANPAAMAAYAEGLERLLQGDSVAAAPALEHAVAEDPQFPAAWVRLANARAQLGYDDLALEAAREAIARLGENSGRIGFEARAQEASLSGDFAHAQTILRTLIERYPHDIEARVALAEALGEHGQLEQARQALAVIVAASPNHPRAWYLLGKYAILAGDNRAAVDEYLVRALVIQNKLDNLQGRADAENALGIAYYQLGELDLATERYRAAIELRQRIGDERGVAAATANVARIELRKGHFVAARSGLQQALDTVERIGDRQTVANLHNEIGFLEEQQGEYRAALERYRKALTVLRDLGDQRALAESYNNVGFAYYLLGDLDNAAVYAQQAMRLYTDTGNREGVMMAGQTVGVLELARGNWEAALKALLEVLAISREVGDTQAEAVALGNIGRVAQFQGRYAAAQDAYHDALAILEPIDDTRGLTEFTLFDASLLFEIGDSAAATQALARVEAWLADSANREQRAEWLRLTGVGQLRTGDLGAARASFAAAIEEANESGSLIAGLAAGLGHAEAQLAAGETGPARDALQALYADAAGLGQRVLTLYGGELLARAALQSGDPASAESVLLDSLRLAEAHRPYAGQFRLHALLAEVLRIQDRTIQAVEQERAAAAELERLGAELDDRQRNTFEHQPGVRDIVREIAIDPAA